MLVQLDKCGDKRNIKEQINTQPRRLSSSFMSVKLEPIFFSLKPSRAPLNLDTVHQKEPIIVIVNKIMCEENKWYHTHTRQHLRLNDTRT